jgi:hypothetical protein
VLAPVFRSLLSRIARGVGQWLSTPRGSYWTLFNEPAVVYCAAVRLGMNDLQTRRSCQVADAINEPGSCCFQRAVLLAKDLRCDSQDNPIKVINEPLVR